MHVDGSKLIERRIDRELIERMIRKRIKEARWRGGRRKRERELEKVKKEKQKLKRTLL